MVGPFLEMHEDDGREIDLPCRARARARYCRWEMVGLFWFIRDYRLFALMAGVRTNADRPTMFEPRGMPPDVSERVRYELRSVWNASWLNTWEVRAVVASYYRHGVVRYAGPGPYRAPMQLRVVLSAMKSIERYGRAARLVFRFDDDG